LLLPGVEKAAEDPFANTPEAIRRWVRRLVQRAPGPVVCCYEAGPLGYGLMRELEALGLRCIVVAPALIPIKLGDRIKTDRRDARKLAELLRAGLLTEVHAPTAEQEAVRDLSRAREAVKRDQIRMRHRLSKFLLRRGVRWTLGRNAWTQLHLEWLRGRRLEYAADQAILDDHLLGLEQIESRLTALDAKLEAVAGEAPYREPVGWLRCFRGIDTLTALALVAELHDWRRFASPRGADGLSGPGAERVFQRRQAASWCHHESGQCPSAKTSGRVGLALPTSAGSELSAARAPDETTRSGDRAHDRLLCVRLCRPRAATRGNGPHGPVLSYD